VRRKKKVAAGSKATEPVNLQELRERARRLVAEQTEDMTKAAAEEASKGHVAQLKYLFEVIGLYPAAEPLKEEPVDGNDLARTLLARLQFPHSLPEGKEDAEIAVPTATRNDSVE
jgi:hypothetical protein